jgi:adenosylhomocysteine nucleosidase
MGFSGPGRPALKGFGPLAISLQCIGIGARDLERQDPLENGSYVVMAGLAGALNPSLEVGDIVLDDLPDGFDAPSGWVRGSIHTTSRIVATPREKADLFAKTGALAVEMEHSIVREWAKRQGAAFTGIRTISDRADQHLNPAVLRLVDAWGRPRPLRIARTLAMQPWIIPELIRLGRDSRHAGARLGLAVREFVAQRAAAESISRSN